MTTEWVYTGELVRVVDGDTVHLRVSRPTDFGFRMEMQLSAVVEFRLVGIDTPERSGKTKGMGDAARLLVEDLLDGEWIDVHSDGKDDKYGRWLARLWLQTANAWLHEELIRRGYARAYDGKGLRLPWDHAAPYPLVRP